MKFILSFIIVMLFIVPFILTQTTASSSLPLQFGSIVITRKEAETGIIKSLILNLNSGTLVNSEHKRFQITKENLDNIKDLLRTLNIGDGNLDLRNQLLPFTFQYFMANTQFGKSIAWQDGTEGAYSILTAVESYFSFTHFAKIIERVK